MISELQCKIFNIYRSDTVNSKSFVSKVFLRNKWKYELTVDFKHEMIGKHFTETSNKVELRINHVRINRVRPVYRKYYKCDCLLFTCPNTIFQVMKLKWLTPCQLIPLHCTHTVRTKTVDSTDSKFKKRSSKRKFNYTRDQYEFWVVTEI